MEPSSNERESWFRDRPPSGLGARLAELSSHRRIGSDSSAVEQTDTAPAPAPPEDAEEPAAEPTTSTASPGDRVAQARHEAGLTTKELAERLGVSIWKVERLERGQDDVIRYAASIGSATCKPADWFEHATAATETSPAGADRPWNGGGRAQPADQRDPAGRHSPAEPETAPSMIGATVVLWSLALLVIIRFFTEIVPVLPRFFNFIDVPILAAIVLTAVIRPARIEGAKQPTLIVVLCFGFVIICVLSTLTNLTRVDIAPALVFVYGFLGPLGLFLAVHSLWPVGAAKRLSRTLVALCLLQFFIVLVFNLPDFIASRNPDVISGTFGENPYQLVFFLLVIMGLLGGIFTFEKRHAIARLTPLLLVAILAVIFLAQYRSLLLTTVLTVVLLGALLSSAGARGVVVTAVASAALLGTLSYAAQNIPALKFGVTLEEARDDPTFYLQKRLETFSSVERVFADTPRFAITGTGPGTYSSRAWRTFAVLSDSESDVAGDYVLQLTQGRPYSTDVSDKYVQPQLRNIEYLGGSTASTRPFASYISLLAEVGPAGFLLIVAMYVWALVRSVRMAVRTGRAARPGDPLPALFCASAVAFFVLLQMGTLDNWLEVTRITFIAWILLAVAMKELAGREQLHAAAAKRAGALTRG